MTNKQITESFVTPAFRLSYPALFTAVAAPGSEKLKYSVTMLFPKKATFDALLAAGHVVAVNKWAVGDDCAAIKQLLLKIARANFGPKVDLKTLKFTKFRDGDKPKESTGKIDDNEKGYWVVRAATETRPDVLRNDKTRVSAENAAELYAGCWVRAFLTVAPFTHKIGGRGVTMYLNGVQKLADDTTFSSRPRAEDAFDAVGAEAPAAGAVSQDPFGD